MNTLFAALKTITTKRLQANKALEAAALKANNGLAPTMDNMGRLHAPVNGYVWEDSTYKGGEYLAIEGGKVGLNCKARLKVSARLVEFLQANNFKVSSGKSWTDNNSGLSVCYAYLENLTQAEAAVIEGVALKQNTKQLVLVSTAEKEGLNIGKAFKFNTRQINTAAGHHCEHFFNVYVDGLSSEVYNLIKFDINKGKYVALPGLKGEQVAFHYPTNKDFIDLTDNETLELKTSQEQAEKVELVKPMLTRIEQLEQLKTRLSGLLSVSNAAGMLRVGKLLLKVHNRIESYN
jgi:hypothetical protein